MTPRGERSRAERVLVSALVWTSWVAFAAAFGSVAVALVEGLRQWFADAGKLLPGAGLVSRPWPPPAAAVGSPRRRGRRARRRRAEPPGREGNFRLMHAPMS